MIKKLLIGAFVSFSLTLTSTAQIDTLINADFNNQQLPTGWLNIDQDNLPQDPASGVTIQGWFFGMFITDSGDSTELVAQSSSWLDGYAPGNKDWLITDSITISKSNAKLEWRSAPAQVGLYQDGYRVLISTTDTTLSSFTDTLTVYAQNINDDPSQFSSGIMHTASEPNTDTTVGFDHGLLANWELSLDSFNGQTIYIAFLHDSDDDWILAIDNVIVTQGTATGIEKHSDLYLLNAYPTPVADFLTIEYNSSVMNELQVTILSIDGKIVYDELLGKGTHTKKLINISEFDAGNYFVYFRNGNHINIKRFSVVK